MGNKQLPSYSMEKKNVIVTGANIGIGFATAQILAKMGAHVIMACRSEQRGQTALDELKKNNPQASAELMLVDLGDFDSIRGFVKTYNEKHKKLHCLINNAGMVAATYAESKYGVESMLTVNYLGPTLLTQLLLDTLEKLPEDEGPPRVVFLASDAHRFPGHLSIKKLEYDTKKAGKTLGGVDTMEQYGLTKLCNILYVREQAKRLIESKSKIMIYAVHPGWVETELGRDDKGGFMRAVESVVAKTPEEGALPSLYCACDPDLAADPKTNGKYYSGIKEKGKLHNGAKDEKAGPLLWDWTQNLLGAHTRKGEKETDS